MVCKRCEAFSETSLSMDVSSNDPDEEEEEDSSHDRVFDDVARLKRVCQLGAP